jgi:hypothetical protein
MLLSVKPGFHLPKYLNQTEGWGKDRKVNKIFLFDTGYALL